MDLISVILLYTDDLNTAPISGVQDNFGRGYKCATVANKPGDVIVVPYRAPLDPITGATGYSNSTGVLTHLQIYYKLAREVPLAEVSALVHLSKHAHRPLQAGVWFEIAPD